jgi:hypothetical protein
MKKFKQLNKNAWTQEEMKVLFKHGKDKTSLEDVHSNFSDRSLKSITNKLYHMGFSFKGGKIL